jgi:hypothetical protein
MELACGSAAVRLIVRDGTAVLLAEQLDRTA